MQELTSLSTIIDRYDFFLIDIWGVLHNGVKAFPEAISALKDLKAAGKTTILFSNSPRRLDANVYRLKHLGIEPEFYSDIFTSGEHCYLSLKEKTMSETRQERYYFLGTVDDLSVVEGLEGYRQVFSISEADFILCTGTRGNEPSLIIYEKVLKEAAIRRIPLLCVNPDLEVYIGDQKIYCAGAIAALYEKVGGKVRYFGKPFPDFYQKVFNDFQIDKKGVLAIGDALRTDILGAHLQGVDSLLVLSGLVGYQDFQRPITSPLNGQETIVKPTYHQICLKF